MRTVPYALCLLATLVCTSRAATDDAAPEKAPATTQSAYLAPDSFDFKTLLGDPPADGSSAQGTEIDLMLMLQAKRTAAELARCKDEEKDSAFTFTDLIGPWFTKDNVPVTARLTKDAHAQTKLVTDVAKTLWKRDRPFAKDSRIDLQVKKEKSASYPSGHSTRGIVLATLLAEVFPDKREAIMARGRLIGLDRTIAGAHYPTDVLAGQTLGAEIAKRMLADPQVQERLKQARAECAAHAAPAPTPIGAAPAQ